MSKYHRFNDLVGDGRVTNRMTLYRNINAGLFPPPINLGPNTVAWRDEDLKELDKRIEDGVTEPHPEWLTRAQLRKARARRDLISTSTAA